MEQTGKGETSGIREYDNGRYDQVEEVFGACAGAALYRRCFFEDVGLFDEDFFLILEDVDLDFRGQLKGHRCYYIPTAVVHHVHSASIVKHSPLQIYHGTRNGLSRLHDWYRNRGIEYPENPIGENGYASRQGVSPEKSFTVEDIEISPKVFPDSVYLIAVCRR